MTERISDAARSCWIRCTVLRRVRSRIQESSNSRLWTFSSLLRWASVLCEQQDCADQVLSTLRSLPIVQQEVVSQIEYPLYILVGIVINSLLLALCFIGLALIVFLWRVGRDALLYTVLLGLLTIAVSLQVAFWVVLLSENMIWRTVEPILGAFGSIFNLLVYFILVVLVLQWVLAMPIVLGKEPFSLRSERIMSVSFVTVNICFIVAIMVVSWMLFFSAQKSSTLYLGLNLAFYLVSFLFSALLGASAGYGYWAVRSRPEASADLLNGLFRSIFIYSFLAASRLPQVIIFSWLLAFAGRPSWIFFPEWLIVGLGNVIGQSVASVCLFVILLMSARRFVRKSRIEGLKSRFLVSEPLRDSLLETASGECSDDAVPLSYQI